MDSYHNTDKWARGSPQGTSAIQLVHKLSGMSFVLVKFADSGKNKVDCEELQEVLSKFYEWATVWQMKLSIH